MNLDSVALAIFMLKIIRSIFLILRLCDIRELHRSFFRPMTVVLLMPSVPKNVQTFN